MFVIFDRQYSPFIFKYQGQTIVPAESVYAAFEAKQTINASLVHYAQEKVASVRRLHRTSLTDPHAGGTFPPKPLPYILGGLLTFRERVEPGDSVSHFWMRLQRQDDERRLDMVALLRMACSGVTKKDVTL